MNANSEIQLIDYIKGNDNKILFIHPQYFSACNFIALLLCSKQMSTTPAFIITEDKNKVNSFLPQSIPDEVYVSYSSSIQSDPEQEVILMFDDLEAYYEYEWNTIQGNFRTIIFSKGNIKIDNDNFDTLHLSLYEQGPLLKYDLKLIDKTKDFSTLLFNPILLDIEKKHLIYGLANANKLDNIISILDLPTNDIKDIEIVHLFNIKLNVYINIIDKIYKRYLLSDKISSLKIIFYVDENNTVEVEEYNKILDYIENYNSNYVELLSKSKKIEYNDEIGLFINN